jgi:hypothetical protein
MTIKEIKMKLNKKPNPTQKIEKMAEAANHIKAAIKALEAAAPNSENWAECETIHYFRQQLEEFMSCDHGEAGFEVYLTKKAGLK